MTDTLDAAAYTDTAIARDERRLIFANNWALFGPEHELASPGDYVAQSVNGWPIVVLRDRDGALRAFHNVCRHRAAALFDEGAGACKAKITCPYHGWSYELDGRLALAPRFGEKLDPEEMGLLALRVEVWRGCIFVCVDPDTPDLLTWLGSVPAFCAPYPETPAFTYRGAFTVEGKANWKTYCDNTVEGYHLPFVHERLSQAVEGASVEIRGHDDHRLVCFHVGYRGDGAELRGDSGLWFYRYPGFQAVIGPTGFKAERIEPVGAGALRSKSWAWYGDDLGEQETADAFAWAEAIVHEDLGICEAVQRNLEAGAYNTGKLSPAMEEHTAAFQALVRQDLAQS
ncbi:MAG: aromatic ring-hydroxylating dioxygenase subunit alpha [Rhodospirillaceae bacterium]|jgi:choline monooxygenase|nr:aromatic ring-hydroxylating dioxygenase subunit alpha [Rhodospirillaceae bacterium]MBT7614141.1 aromatic ring-hydroxylating dioxygenase subunit alpha [Rhodospirillaceae bacterium]MBT7646165.1 aromatic ring-hydroxylating dioxygenase subunit alpha [Rhodospirillaceae bacterium]